MFALLAAAFYAINIPFSKLLLNHVGATTMAALLYLGAGIGIGILSLFHKQEKSEKLNREDLPFVIGMIVLDIAAPIFLMLGISYGSSSNASLLGNFEIVATSVIALAVFKETVSRRLWVAIAFITLSSILLSFEGADSFRFSYGSLFVLLATVCWGFENNCTRNISSKSTYEIVILKGVFSGFGSLIIAFIKREAMPQLTYIVLALLLGFVAYGLSIFLYVRAQNTLGAAKTSAYYAVAPFIGVFLSFVFLKERITGMYLIALAFMIAGTALVVADTLSQHHAHAHQHTFTHTHDGSTHKDVKGFLSLWGYESWDKYTDAFKGELNEVIDTLRNDERFGGIWKTRKAMNNYCCNHPEAKFDDGKEYGFRVDSEKYACNSQKVSDHHAIVPTEAAGSADLAALPAGERAILRLVARQVLCAVGDPHVYAETTVTMECGGAVFTAKGRTILSLGWKGWLKQEKKEKPLPELSEGLIFPVDSAVVKEGKRWFLF